MMIKFQSKFPQSIIYNIICVFDFFFSYKIQYLQECKSSEVDGFNSKSHLFIQKQQVRRANIIKQKSNKTKDRHTQETNFYLNKYQNSFLK